MAQLVWEGRAVGLGGIQIGLFRLEYRNVTGRLDRRRGLTTCVWQAKRLKRRISQFYSASIKGHLPQCSGFSVRPDPVYSERFTSVSQNGFRPHENVFRKCFQAKCQLFSYGFAV